MIQKKFDENTYKVTLNLTRILVVLESESPWIIDLNLRVIPKTYLKSSLFTFQSHTF